MLEHQQGEEVNMAGKKPGVETYNEGGVWKNRVQGNQRASSTHDTVGGT